MKSSFEKMGGTYHQEGECITEQFNAENQMEWVRQMNNARGRAVEMINSELIYI